VDRPLEYKQTYKFTFFGPQPDPALFRQRFVVVRAVLFQDGGVWGEQEWIDTILSVRKTAYRCETEALQVMMDAKVHSGDGASILQKLDELEQTERAQAPSVNERIVIGQVFLEVKGNIAGSTQVQASLPHSFDPGNLTPATPHVDTAIHAVTSRIHSLEAAGLTSSM
jgi:hypothetical protein